MAATLYTRPDKTQAGHTAQKKKYNTKLERLCSVYKHVTVRRSLPPLADLLRHLSLCMSRPRQSSFQRKLMKFYHDVTRSF